MKKPAIALLTIGALVLSSLAGVQTSLAASPAGKTCSKVGQTKVVSSRKYTCVKVKGKKVWNKGVAIAPAPTPTPTPSPTPVAGDAVLHAPVVLVKNIPIDAAQYDPLTDVKLPASLKAAPAGATLKLFITDPFAPGTGLADSGLFIENPTPDAGWMFYPANADGTFFAALADGTYAFDTVEPAGQAAKYPRKRYSATITGGVATVKGRPTETGGMVIVTLGKGSPSLTTKQQAWKDATTAAANKTVSSFTPSSICQMLDQVTPSRGIRVDLSAGFPRVANRLPSFGQIRALVVPVDYTDLKGKDNAGEYFSTLSTQVRDFYYAQSYGKVAFDFTVLSDWVHMPFTAAAYDMGQVNGNNVGNGRPGDYLNDMTSLIGNNIDFSEYDVAYFLPPKEITLDQNGWGPGVTNMHFGGQGYLTNAALGGGDMYFVRYTQGDIDASWKWMAHETGHLFGLYDEDQSHKSQTLGHWSLMAMNWSRTAIGLPARDRYLVGWLPQEQVSCLSLAEATAGKTVTLSPLEKVDKAVKAIMVPITGSKMLVIESRKTLGFDKISAANQGVLVYTVDMKRGQLNGGYVVAPRTGSTDLANFTDAPLRQGDSITVGGVKITVTSISPSGDTVTVGG